MLERKINISSHISIYTTYINTIQSPSTIVTLTIPINKQNFIWNDLILWTQFFNLTFRDLLLSINKCFVMVWHIERLSILYFTYIISIYDWLFQMFQLYLNLLMLIRHNTKNFNRIFSIIVFKSIKDFRIFRFFLEIYTKLLNSS